uniref:Uncharacterized protein n=1 Tax=Ditylenchus dipsaci TaxID=166011 RepID=A0A915E5Y3_9BILA
MDLSDDREMLGATINDLLADQLKNLLRAIDKFDALEKTHSLVAKIFLDKQFTVENLNLLHSLFLHTCDAFRGDPQVENDEYASLQNRYDDNRRLMLEKIASQDPDAQGFCVATEIFVMKKALLDFNCIFSISCLLTSIQSLIPYSVSRKSFVPNIEEPITCSKRPARKKLLISNFALNDCSNQWSKIKTTLIESWPQKESYLVHQSLEDIQNAIISTSTRLRKTFA